MAPRACRSKGLTVVAIEQAVAAPFCSSRLADAGARVIKIERPEGDFARGYDDVVAGQSSYFVWLNRGKESLVLDLTKAGPARHPCRRCSPGPTCCSRTLSPVRSTDWGSGPSGLGRSTLG